jgi:hypothetical protein
VWFVMFVITCMCFSLTDMYLSWGMEKVMAAAEEDLQRRPLEDILEENREAMKSLNVRGIQPNYLIQGTYDLSNQYYQRAGAKSDSSDMTRELRISEYFAVRAHELMDRFIIGIQSSIIYYLWLLLPFAFFLERLLFATENRYKQMLTRLVMFLICVLILYFNHPAFYGNLEPFRLVIQLVMLDLLLTLLTPTITNGFNRFGRNVRERFEHERRHQIDVGRSTATIMAFLLGVANMRRRRMRTLLTCATLVILTFSVLAFVSFQSDLGFNIVQVGSAPSYEGVLIRDANLHPLPFVLNDIASDYIRGKEKLLARAWLYKQGNKIEFKIHDRMYNAAAVLGLNFDEPGLMGQDMSLNSGRWFEEGETGSAIVSQKFAEDSNIVIGDPIGFADRMFVVVGIFDADGFERLLDLDGKPLSPRTAMTKTDDMGYVTIIENQVAAADTVILPYLDVIEMGGTLQSLAIKAGEERSPAKIRDDLAVCMPYTLFVGEGNLSKGYILTTLLSAKGMENLMMPMIIVGLIVLNTMLGSVYERYGEIGIYSSIGLSPSHIGGLFFAESIVYALVGAVSGYMIGLLATRIIVAFDLLPGLILNYSSFSTLYTMGAVMLVVMLSSIYPSFMASRIAVPKIERRWRFPQLIGERAELVLPFMFSHDEALGALVYLKSVFDGAIDKTYMFGSVIESKLRAVDFENGEGYFLRMTVHLAPYDLGINQLVWVYMIPRRTSGVFDIKVKLKKLTGDGPSWNRSNRPFLTEMRKQCLVWRTISLKVKEDYAIKGKKLFVPERLGV